MMQERTHKTLNFEVEHSHTLAIRRLALDRGVSATRLYRQAIEEFVKRHCPAPEPEKAEAEGKD